METENKQLEIFDLLNVNLKVFEGPLDLLLDLIRKKKMDIQDIPLAEICEPYLEYLDLMDEFNMDIAIEFLDIASTLILIKSRTLLPNDPVDLSEEEGMDTEEQLRQKLIEYQKYKTIAESLNERELLGRDQFPRPEIDEEQPEGVQEMFQDLTVYGLIKAYHGIIRKKGYRKPHEVSREEYSIEQKILEFMKIFLSGEIQLFRNLCPREPSKAEIIISFMAVLELARLFLLQLHQMQEFGPLHCKPKSKIGDYIPQYQEQFPNAS
ncbi:MAG: segregation/condensation protein A [Proteobacteria bacterium]|nr:segregation/condensation protein A [Pseudomonadota bacterium]